MRPAVRHVGPIVGIPLLACVALAADPEGTPASRAALVACETARETNEIAHFDDAVRRAEEAVRASDDDALAHFALFCALGERLRHRGVSARSVLELRRLRAEIDRTLALAPTFPDALVGKANLLLDAPWILGGDVPEAERLLRRALEIDPTYVGARLDLARTLERRGDQGGARVEARRALDEAVNEGDPEDVRKARALVAKLGE